MALWKSTIRTCSLDFRHGQAGIKFIWTGWRVHAGHAEHQIGRCVLGLLLFSFFVLQNLFDYWQEEPCASLNDVFKHIVFLANCRSVWCWFLLFSTLVSRVLKRRGFFFHAFGDLMPGLGRPCIQSNNMHCQLSFLLAAKDSKKRSWRLRAPKWQTANQQIMYQGFWPKLKWIHRFF